MKTIVKKVPDLTPIEYRACYLANYGEWGYMRATLQNARELHDSDAIAVLLVDETRRGATALIGWALLTPVSTSGMLAATRYTKSKSKYTVQFWVKQQHRKKGHGKTLMAAVKKLDPLPHVLPHDEKSGQFFSSWNVTVLNGDRPWLKRKTKIA